MKQFLKKAAFFGLIVLLYFSVSGVYNYTLDPYGILETRKEFVGIRPNEHSLKVHHVLQNSKEFNSFLFSNSKGGALHFNQLNDQTNNWYNMTYSLGTPEEFHHDMVLFVNNNVAIKNIVIGLDEGVIYERASSHKNQASRKFVPIVNQSINWEYLFLPISLKKFLRIDLDKKHIIHDVYKSGNYLEQNAYPDNCDLTEELVIVPQPNEISQPLLDFSSQINTLKSIQDFCKKKNINLSFLVHPTSLENHKKSEAKRFQFNQLLGVMENEQFVLFRPFEKNLIQNSSCYWLDRHHYTKKVGDSILQMYTQYKDLDTSK